MSPANEDHRPTEPRVRRPDERHVTIADDAVPPSLSRAPTWLLAVTRHAATSPRATLIWASLIAVFAVVIGVRFLPLEASRSELIDPSAEFQKRWRAYTDEFGEQSEIVVTVGGNDADVVREAADSLANQLQASEHVRDVFGTVDWSRLASRSLQFASADDVKRITGDTRETLIPNATGGAGVAPSAARLTGQLQSAADAGDPAAWHRALANTQSFADSLEKGDAGIALAAMPFDSPEFPQPNVFDDGRFRVVTVFPAVSEGLAGAAPAVAAVREVVQRHRDAYSKIDFGVTGVPVLESDEMRQSSRDMTVASLVSAGGVALLLCWGFRGRRLPMLVLITLLIALAWSVGWAACSVGRLNILSISFAAILIGLGVDFALHWLAHVDDAERRARRLISVEEACVTAAASCGPGIATAAITTATAFFVASVTPFRGLAELGLIAGGGVILCAAAALVLTPALFAVRPSNAARLGTPRYARRLAFAVEKYAILWLFVSAAVVAAAVGVGFDRSSGFRPRVTYDGNLLNMQPADMPSLDAQQKLENATSHGVLFAVSRTPSASAGRELADKLEDLPEVGAVNTLGRVMPEPSAAEQRALRELAAFLDVRTSGRIAPSDRDDAVAALTALDVAVGGSSTVEAEQIQTQLRSYADQLERLSAEQAREQLERYARASANTAGELIVRLRAAADPSPVSPDDLPEELRTRFVGADGTWLVFTFPAESVWETRPLAEFVASIRTVDPDATGTPIQNLEATRQIKLSYRDAFGYASLAIFLILFLDASTPTNVLFVVAGAAGIVIFARTTAIGGQWGDTMFGWTLLFLSAAVVASIVFDVRGALQTIAAAIPSIIGGIITVGLLAVCGIDFNPANLIVLPLILGIGVDDGVHILHGLRGPSGRVPAATIHALTMTSLSSAVGFGSLMLSSHRGLASLGLTLVIGVAACYFVSLFLLLPAAYWLKRPTAEDDHDPLAGDAIYTRRTVGKQAISIRDAGDSTEY